MNWFLEVFTCFWLVLLTGLGVEFPTEDNGLIYNWYREIEVPLPLIHHLFIHIGQFLITSELTIDFFLFFIFGPSLNRDPILVQIPSTLIKRS